MATERDVPELTDADLIPVYIMGKRYMVPSSLTIMKAMEWAGYTLIRGVGCRGGFCGACATTYRVLGDPKLYFGLACQTVVQPDMYLAQIPFFPAQRATYDVTQLEPTATTLLSRFTSIRLSSVPTKTFTATPGTLPLTANCSANSGSVGYSRQTLSRCIPPAMPPALRSPVQPNRSRVGCDQDISAGWRRSSAGCFRQSLPILPISVRKTGSRPS